MSNDTYDCKNIFPEISDLKFLELLIQHFLSYQNLSAFDNYVFLFSILLILTEVYT